jgi:hypothetical protein
MAGTIIADYIRADANRISLNVGNTVIASINAMGLLSNTGVQIINQNGQINAASIAAGTIPAGALASGAVSRSNMYTGAVLQVVQGVKTDSYAAATGALWAAIPGITASITPTSTSSKILVLLDVKFIGNTDESISRLRLMRDSTAVYVGDSAGSRPRISSGQHYNTSGGSGGYNFFTSGGFFLDSPSTTSSITYTVQIGGDGNGNVLYVNRTESDRDAANYDGRAASSITLIEIAG